MNIAWHKIYYNLFKKKPKKKYYINYYIEMYYLYILAIHLILTIFPIII